MPLWVYAVKEQKTSLAEIREGAWAQGVVCTAGCYGLFLPYNDRRKIRARPMDSNRAQRTHNKRD